MQTFRYVNYKILCIPLVDIIIYVRVAAKINRVAFIQYFQQILHSPPTSSVTAVAESFCSLVSSGVNAMHWKVVPFQVEFVLSTRNPLY